LSGRHGHFVSNWVCSGPTGRFYRSNGAVEPVQQHRFTAFRTI
jgi:hypothetical protein